MKFSKSQRIVFKLKDKGSMSCGFIGSIIGKCSRTVKRIRAGTAELYPEDIEKLRNFLRKDDRVLLGKMGKLLDKQNKQKK